MFLRSLNLTLLFSALLFTQSGPPSFDAAEIKLVKPSGNARVSGDYQHGRLIVHNATLHMLINSAYGTRFDLIVGGPKWMDADLFDIAAKADPATTEAESRLMLRTLLEERFHLQTHHDPRPSAVFALVVAKGGPRFQKTPEGSAERQGCYGSPFVCHKVTLSDMAGMLPNIAGREIDRLIVDLTGLEGRYDIPLPHEGRSVFDSLAAAGLQLEPRKHAIDYLVVDRADRLPD
jgi:uncharacterized protein (TIGR03435 family)